MASHEVVFARSRTKAVWDGSDEALLYLAERAGVGIPYACAQGQCGTCVTALLEGRVSYARPPEFRFRAGMCLPCVARPESRVVLDA